LDQVYFEFPVGDNNLLNHRDSPFLPLPPASWKNYVAHFSLSLLAGLLCHVYHKKKSATPLPNKHPRSWNESWTTAQSQVQRPEPERQQQPGREIAENRQKVENI